ncbi:MAG: GvpL/GvpF family gas vesicle protein [Chloroflexi bacterium]|nr:GvpL/GvpF family gas vesicle protein [Chloroflexota bacterium]
MTQTLVYLYAVLPHTLDGPVQGIDASLVRWINAERLAAAVSDVPADDFEEEPLNTNVRNMAWLAPRAVAHQDVNERLFEASEAIVPLAFGTVFRDDDRVRQLLSEKAKQLQTQLARVRGCAEWVVALHALHDPDVNAAAEVRELQGQIAASTPGRAHLLRRQLATAERDAARRLRTDAAAQVLEGLRVATVEVFEEPLPSDTVERPLLRASVLVRRDAEATFMDEVERLRARWPEPTYRLLLTGPWPPYRFAGLQRAAD